MVHFLISDLSNNSVLTPTYDVKIETHICIIPFIVNTCRFTCFPFAMLEEVKLTVYDHIPGGKALSYTTGINGAALSKKGELM